MAGISNTARSWLALFCWLGGLALFAGLGMWNLTSSRADAENRLISEAGRTAAQIAGLLSLPDSRLDPASVKALISAAMEDDHIYAVKIETSHGLREGERRNHLWEPMPWDEEIAENCVQGMNSLRIGGRPEGVVEVWLSPRLNSEENGLIAQREFWRLGLGAAAWTAVFVFLFWSWGDFKRIAGFFRQSDTEMGHPEEALGLTNHPEEQSGPPALVSAFAGREYQKAHPDSWLVTAGMFRQTFDKAPALIMRLYSGGQLAALSHLARMLEQAAPCIGARQLAEAAAQMRQAINDPEAETPGLAVERCTALLDKTLGTLASGTDFTSTSAS